MKRFLLSLTFVFSLVTVFAQGGLVTEGPVDLWGGRGYLQCAGWLRSVTDASEVTEIQGLAADVFPGRSRDDALLICQVTPWTTDAFFTPDFITLVSEDGWQFDLSLYNTQFSSGGPGVLHGAVMFTASIPGLSRFETIQVYMGGFHGVIPAP